MRLSSYAQTKTNSLHIGLYTHGYVLQKTKDWAVKDVKFAATLALDPMFSVSLS